VLPGTAAQRTDRQVEKREEGNATLFSDREYKKHVRALGWAYLAELPGGSLSRRVLGRQTGTKRGPNSQQLNVTQIK